MDAKKLSAFMREMGRRGGLIGGKRRMETMSPQARSAVASKAALARWGRKPKPFNVNDWPNGTRFSVTWLDGLTWRHCIVTHTTLKRLYFAYPEYDGTTRNARRVTWEEFAARVSKGDIQKEKS